MLPVAETLILPCNANSGGLPVEIQASSGAQGVTVNLMAFHVSGYNRLYDRNVPVHLTPNQDASNVYRSQTSITYTGNSTAWWRLNAFSSDNTASLCFPNDRLITGESTIRVVIMGGSGYTINPNMSAVDIRVNDDASDDCTSMGGIMTNGGRIYNWEDGGCICANQSLVVQNGIADGENESYATSALFWRTDSTNYCSDSPYKGR